MVRKVPNLAFMTPRLFSVGCLTKSNMIMIIVVP